MSEEKIKTFMSHEEMAEYFSRNVGQLHSDTAIDYKLKYEQEKARADVLENDLKCAAQTLHDERKVYRGNIIGSANNQGGVPGCGGGSGGGGTTIGGSGGDRYGGGVDKYSKGGGGSGIADKTIYFSKVENPATWSDLGVGQESSVMHAALPAGEPGKTIVIKWGDEVQSLGRYGLIQKIENDQTQILKDGAEPNPALDVMSATRKMLR